MFKTSNAKRIIFIFFFTVIHKSKTSKKVKKKTSLFTFSDDKHDLLLVTILFVVKKTLFEVTNIAGMHTWVFLC